MLSNLFSKFCLNCLTYFIVYAYLFCHQFRLFHPPTPLPLIVSELQFNRHGDCRNSVTPITTDSTPILVVYAIFYTLFHLRSYGYDGCLTPHSVGPRILMQVFKLKFLHAFPLVFGTYARTCRRNDTFYW